MNPNINPKGIKNPFRHFCMSVGAIPTSYKESLSYYETLLWLIRFLEEKVIPAVDNNALALAELQRLFVELKNYVENYFDNLDVQEEINNKLDEMVEDGTLQEIISDYLNSKAVFGFDTVASMKTATNLIDGSYAETLGYYSVNDGGGAIYKVREITNDDIVDNAIIIPLHNQNLIAELINDKCIYNAKQLGLKTNGNDNSDLFTNVFSNIPAGSTIYFPEGKYVFNSPIVINKRINIEGEEISITDIDKNYGSVLLFNNLSENATALTLPGTKSLIKNIMIESNSYDLTDDRSLCTKGVDVFTETVNTNNVNGIGFSNIAYGTTIKNCRFRGFSGFGINGSTFIIVEDCSFWKCNVGLKIVSDCTVTNLRFFHVKNGIRATGANNLITNIRMDSVKETGIYVQGQSNIITDINIDYCQYNAINLHNCSDTIVKNVVARCGTIYPYDSTNDGNIISFEPSSDYSKYLGIVLMSGYANTGNNIEVPVAPRNPLDSESNLKCSLFGVTTINTPYRNNYTCLLGKEYNLLGQIYVGNFSRAVYICNGNITGNIQFNGAVLKTLNSINDFRGGNWSKILLSSFATPTQ